ncbi:MAG: endonuclease [Gammaproteobacteria bacterium]|nr:endonuclease [Gammaproteobacteria bacterium]
MTRRPRKRTAAALLFAVHAAFLLAFPAAVAAANDGGALRDYMEARGVFWSQLYDGGGETLYCGMTFTRGRGARKLNIEHVFPMSWVTRALKCGRRNECRKRSARFNRIEADLHNLYPARADINQERSSMAFGIVRGEKRRYGQCDFEVNRRKRRAEPRPAARGKIARAMFYMADRYRLTIFPRQRRLLRQWNRAHPPGADEKRRNDVIQRLQGRRNPYIDNPSLADAPNR